MGKKLKKKAPQKKNTAQRNGDSKRDNWPLYGSKDSDSKSPQDEQENEASDKIIDQQDLFNKMECALKEEVTRLKAQLECAFKVHQMLQDEVISLKNKQNEKLPQPDKEQENEILELRQQVEEGRKAEEILKKQYVEKEEQHQVEINILKSKLEEKDKLL